MKILHIADFGKTKVNGISEVVDSLALEQQKLGHRVIVYLIRNNPISYSNSRVSYCVKRKIDFVSLINDFFPDIVIFHSLYKIEYITYSRYLNKKNIIYSILFHGATSFQNYEKSKLKKRIANFLFFNKFVLNASSCFFLCNREYENSIFKKKILSYYIIPNGIHLNIFEKKMMTDKIELVYLSRMNIYPKGLDILVQALYLLNEDIPLKAKVHFSFYGHGDKKEINMFKGLLAGLKGFADYYGPVFGEDKWKVLKSSNIFILTSRSEGMPISILEALSYGCPSLITNETNMGELIETNNAGWIVSLDSREIAKGLKEACQEYVEKRTELCQNARNAVLPFTWEKIATISINSYTEIIEKERSRFRK